MRASTSTNPARVPILAAVMGDFLNHLRDEAVQLADSDLPSQEEVRSVVGALANRLERLEQEVVGEVKPAPAAPEPHVPTELEKAEQELQAAQARVAALQAGDGVQGGSPAAPSA